MKKIKERLMEANSLLRSAYSIAMREGKATNWKAFKKRVGDELDIELPIINAIKSPPKKIKKS